MTRSMRGTDRAKGMLEKRKNFLYPVAQRQTGQLKLTGEVTHILAGGRHQIHPARGQLFSFGLRQIAAIPDHDAIFHPAGERGKQFAIIHGGGGEIKPTQPPGFVTLHVELKAIPPAHAVFGLPRPVAKGPMLPFPRNVTDRNRGGVLQHDGIRPLRVAIAMKHQGQECPQLDTLPVRGLNKLAVRAQRGELLAMIGLNMKIHFGLVRQAAPRPPD